KAAPASAAKPAAPKPAAAPAPKSATPKAGADPDRKLMKRYTYAGVADTGPIEGETFEQKVAKLKAVAAAAKQRADEGGSAAIVAPDAPVVETVLEAAMTPPATSEASDAAGSTQTSTAPSASAEHKPTGQADRSLMIRSTYCGVRDTGPVPGETFEQKVERLRAVSAAAKQRAEGG